MFWLLISQLRIFKLTSILKSRQFYTELQFLQLYKKEKDKKKKKKDEGIELLHHARRGDAEKKENFLTFVLERCIKW